MSCLSWAVILKNGKYVMAGNDLPFIIRETEEIIEPFKEAGRRMMLIWLLIP